MYLRLRGMREARRGTKWQTAIDLNFWQWNIYWHSILHSTEETASAPSPASVHIVNIQSSSNNNGIERERRVAPGDKLHSNASRDKRD